MATAATAGRPDREYWVLWGVALAVLCSSAYAAAATGVVGQMPRIWLFSTVAFSWMTLDWNEDGRLLPRLTPPFVLTVGATALLACTTALLMDAPTSDVIRSVVGVPLQAFLMAFLYRSGRRTLQSPHHPHLDGVGPWRNAWARNWAPTCARDLGLLAGSALVSGAVGLLLGAVPGLHLGEVSTSVALQWMSHVFVVSSVGGATTLITFATWSPASLREPWLRILAVWLVSVGLLSWVYATGAVTMAWLAVLPVVFVALNRGLWVTNTFGLLVGLVSILLSPALNTLDGRSNLVRGSSHLVPLGSVMDLVVSTFILVSLLVAQLSQRRAQLVDDLERERSRVRRRAEMLQNVFEAMQDGVVVVDRHLAVRMHNPAAVTLLGRPFPKGRPESWTGWFGITRIDGTPLSDSELIASDFMNLGIHGGQRILRQSVTRVSSDPADGWMIFLTDNTEHHARLRELSGFAGVVAHDLRAPLTSVEGWLEMAEESLASRDPDEASALLARARASNRRMREVISDWLDYTVVREGTLELADVPLTTPVRAVMAQVAEIGPHVFTVDTPHHVSADLGLVRQLLANLIGNASKFVRHGETPTITVRSMTDVAGWIRVDVIDEGIGLPVGEEDRIFEDYHRAAGAAQSREGFGMGLAACRRIVERHGGQISAHTNDRGGATFSFTLPAAEWADELTGLE
ncbi:sensor histidine kinase [Nocardioides jishulii]|uniref:sensor histidine kinase n=1 Tax=Nocardioides jishulii TaxID=2575440 RepID=UPI0014851E1E|nr:PAS domain-containing sensor histidine kinase [Nocardioides jishulii]